MREKYRAGGGMSEREIAENKTKMYRTYLIYTETLFACSDFFAFNTIKFIGQIFFDIIFNLFLNVLDFDKWSISWQ